jgi:hypothetical protein
MTRSRVVRVLIGLSMAGWVAAIGSAGCTSGSASTGTPSGSGKTLARQLAEAHCARHCCDAASDAGAADAGSTGDCTTDAAAPVDGGSSCVARVELAANEQLAVLSTAYAEGLLAVNPQVTQACVAAYQSSACGAAPAALDVDQALSGPDCAGLFLGYIPSGSRCDTTVECMAGTFCLSEENGRAITSLSGAGALGVCFPYQTAGEACNTTADCLPPLTCNPSALVCQQ